MFKVDQLTINPNLSDELQKLSGDLVGYVVEKYTNKVVNVAVLTRASLPRWYMNRQTEFDVKKYNFCIGSISMLGSVLGIETTEIHEKSDEKTKGGEKKNEYKVN